MKYTKFHVNNAIATLTLNRPHQYNAFNPEFILEILTHLQYIEKDAAIRLVLLKANGKHFSAGADIAWMKNMAFAPDAENQLDANLLADFFCKIDHCSKPIITITHGRVIGGALGIVACSDFVIASHDALFCFSELKLGLMPAIIAPYIIRNMGFRSARRYFLSSETFSARQAQQEGLITHTLSYDEIDTQVNTLIANLLQLSPQAITATKQLLRAMYPIDKIMIDRTTQLLVEARNSHDAREGLTAFLEKRRPNWCDSD